MMKVFTLFKKVPFYGYLLYFFCFFSLGALGFFRLEDALTSTLKAIIICAVQAILISFFFILIHRNFSRKLFLLFIMPYFLISWLYLPQAIMYGSISSGIIASLFETNPSESYEYIQSFPKYVYIIWLAYLLLYSLVLIKTKQQTTNNKQQTTNNKQQTTNNKQQTTNNKQQTTRFYFFIPLYNINFSIDY